jgi:hypothetical protein
MHKQTVDLTRLARLARGRIGVAFACTAAIASAAAGGPPTKDLAGLTSNKDLGSGVVPITDADTQFYLKVMRASLDRYQHPSAQDTADLAEQKRYLARIQQLQERLAKDPSSPSVQADYAKVLQDPSPAESAARERATHLRGGNVPSYEGVPEVLAIELGMPSYQWEHLAQAVEDAAGTEHEGKWGSGDADPTGPVTPELQARRALVAKARAASRSIVAPQAAEVHRLHEQVARYESERAEQTPSS